MSTLSKIKIRIQISEFAQAVRHSVNLRGIFFSLTNKALCSMLGKSEVDLKKDIDDGQSSLSLFWGIVAGRHSGRFLKIVCSKSS